MIGANPAKDRQRPRRSAAARTVSRPACRSAVLSTVDIDIA
jgi:hypothetical protein